MSATAKMPARPKTTPDPAPHLAAALALGGRATLAEKALLFAWSPALGGRRPTTREVADHLGVGMAAAAHVVDELAEEALWPPPPHYSGMGPEGRSVPGPSKLAMREGRAVLRRRNPIRKRRA